MNPVHVALLVVAREAGNVWFAVERTRWTPALPGEQAPGLSIVSGGALKSVGRLKHPGTVIARFRAMRPIEDYALLGDTHSAALVSRTGAVDWLCWPRFDSHACFAALVGNEENGSWQIAPEADIRRVRRHYRPGTLVLETDLEGQAGVIRIIDCMVLRRETPRLVRIVQGLEGRVSVCSRLRARFGFGRRTPWQQGEPDRVTMTAGPDALLLRASVPQELGHGHVSARFELAAGEQATFQLAWFPSHERAPADVDVDSVVAETERTFRAWADTCTYRGKHADAVLRSVLTLKALTYCPTGAVVAAPTSSLPEKLGGVRNWDYRYCWLRDATLTLLALMDVGFVREAVAFRDWLMRAVAGDPDEVQIMYGIAGERKVPELEMPWLPGYADSRPVRIGNAAHAQHQLDIYGELMDCLYQARQQGTRGSEDAWSLERALLDHVAAHWREPDKGIWEIRAPRQQFTHSKVMAWVAVDRAIKAAHHYRQPAPVEAWRALRARIHAEVCENGVSVHGHFTQTYGGREVDASLLMIPLVGFLPPEDPRVIATVREVERDLVQDGLVHRYDTARCSDGLPPGEGVFLVCSFWLANNYLLLGRRGEAEELFERIVGLSNDVGLLAEQYDPVNRRLLGNFPQAFSHVGLVDTALDLYGPKARVTRRGFDQNGEEYAHGARR